ncbi:MAG: hypothetical protein ACLUEQ_02115 [Cloacibacillus evryensis]
MADYGPREWLAEDTWNGDERPVPAAANNVITITTGAARLRRRSKFSTTMPE